MDRLFITVGGEESDNRGAEVGLGGGDSPGQSGGHSPQAPATKWLSLVARFHAEADEATLVQG